MELVQNNLRIFVNGHVVDCVDCCGAAGPPYTTHILFCITALSSL